MTTNSPKEFSTKSTILGMHGWSKRLMNAASARNAANADGSLSRGRQCFTAHSLLSVISRAAYTTDIPPRPTTKRSRYRPPMRLPTASPATDGLPGCVLKRDIPAPDARASPDAHASPAAPVNEPADAPACVTAVASVSFTADAPVFVAANAPMTVLSFVPLPRGTRGCRVASEPFAAATAKGNPIHMCSETTPCQSLTGANVENFRLLFRHARICNLPVACWAKLVIHSPAPPTRTSTLFAPSMTRVLCSRRLVMYQRNVWAGPVPRQRFTCRVSIPARNHPQPTNTSGRTATS